MRFFEALTHSKLICIGAIEKKNWDQLADNGGLKMVSEGTGVDLRFSRGGRIFKKISRILSTFF